MACGSCAGCGPCGGTVEGNGPGVGAHSVGIGKTPTSVEIGWGKIALIGLGLFALYKVVTATK